MDEFLGKVETDDCVSDFWLFEDDYIKEVRYTKDGIDTRITEIDEFMKDNPDHKVIDKLKEYKEI